MATSLWQREVDSQREEGEVRTQVASGGLPALGLLIARRALAPIRWNATAGLLFFAVATTKKKSKGTEVA